jgi:hypothetical protein
LDFHFVAIQYDLLQGEVLLVQVKEEMKIFDCTIALHSVFCIGMVVLGPWSDQ